MSPTRSGAHGLRVPQAPRAALVVGGLGLTAYSWWVAGLPHFSAAALAAVGLPGVAVLAAGGMRRSRPGRGEGRVAGRVTDHGPMTPWAALLGALLGWELLAYSLSPRSDHPTLSSLADAALRPRPVEAVAFLAWLWLGWALARR